MENFAPPPSNPEPVCPASGQRACGQPSAAGKGSKQTILPSDFRGSGVDIGRFQALGFLETPRPDMREPLAGADLIKS